jgi:hypothetical protein
MTTVGAIIARFLTHSGCFPNPALVDSIPFGTSDIDGDGTVSVEVGDSG